jgi:hypothetical protein
VSSLAIHTRRWADDLEYAEVSFRGVQGHRQVTDTGRARPARRLVNFAAGLAALDAEVAETLAARGTGCGLVFVLAPRAASP